LKITSTFLPSHALQGQKVPSHLLWSGSEYTEIEIRYSTELRLCEIYNVSEGNYANKDNVLKVQRVGVEGYLGLVFDTSRQPTNRINATVNYTIRKNEEITCQEDRAVYLFRSDLSIVDAPPVISINKKGVLDKRVGLNNLGEGTAVVLVTATPESPVKLVRPAYVREFLESYSNDVNTKLVRLKDEYPQYSEILDQFVSDEKQAGMPPDSTPPSEVRTAVAELMALVEHDEQFAKSLIEVFVSCILSNIFFRTIAGVFLDYINSIGKNRTLFVDPFSILEIPSGEADVELRIKSTDLLYAECPDLPTLKIHFKAEERCEIPVQRLIRWG
jgi:hypothetical protein